MTNNETKNSEEIAQQEQECRITPTEASSLNSNLSTTIPSIPKKVADMNAILDYIKQNQPVSCWKLCKTLNIPNSSLYYKIRDLEFAGLIYSKVVVNEKNRTERLLYSITKTGDNNEQPKM